jgi:hypothetical protein
LRPWVSGPVLLLYSSGRQDSLEFESTALEPGCSAPSPACCLWVGWHWVAHLIFVTQSLHLWKPHH